MLNQPQCSKRKCIHLTGAYSPDPEDPEVGQVPACKAFPKGIPQDIAYGSNKHLKPVAGDHGIQYEGPENA